MIIKSLYLKNIRSYNEQEFRFREGMTLLSGDIGSGKSTVLLSIEFALFGLIRGSINGSSLLRHGCKDATVRLLFSINKDTYVIERSLKRTSAGIAQDKCSFSKNKEIEQLTPIELKSKILSVLGYPDDLVSKSKTLIFRYTVYTPQEEMKQIIFESKEERLEKLRRIFGVDKYELIKNNASMYAKDLRSEIRNYAFVKEEHESLKEKIKEILTETNLLYEESDTLKKHLMELNKSEERIKQRNKDYDDKIKNFNELKTKNNMLVNEINSLTNNLKDEELEIKRLQENISNKEKIIEKLPEQKKSVEEIKREILELNKKREEFDRKVNDAKQKKAIIKNKSQEIKELIDEVEHLDNCPTCKQEVNQEHKEELRTKETEKLNELKNKEETLKTILEKAEQTKKKYDEKKKELEEELEQTKNLEFKKKLQEQKIKFIDETKERIKAITDKTNIHKKTIEEKQKKLEETKKELLTYKYLEEEIKQIKKEQEELNLIIRTQEKKLSAIEQSIKDKEKNRKEKTQDLEKKEKILKETEQKKTLENWISNHFTNLVSIIEKQFLAKIHREFNSLFKEWFSMLIDDTELEANLEQDFSPSIIQNGYDSSIENLSGGEKTAISLAYRLALNKVINDLVHDVETKGLMILDEPTDGFSSEQLDKVRDVLEKTNIKQIIIVSHEAKLESFVQNIIRINKNNHESGIIQV